MDNDSTMEINRTKEETISTLFQSILMDMTDGNEIWNDKNINTRKCMGYPTCRLYHFIDASKTSFTECNDVSYLF